MSDSDIKLESIYKISHSIIEKKKVSPTFHQTDMARDDRRRSSQRRLYTFMSGL